MNKPLVSVIMPVYNGEKYIRKAVESVYEQGVSLELLVIDDGSTDHTEEVLSAYEGREDFRYIKNQQNMGAAGSRNRGVRLPYDASKIFEQWVAGCICLALAMVALFFLVRTRGRKMSLNGKEVMAAGVVFRVDDIARLDLRRWKLKGLAIATLKPECGGARIRLDGLTYGGFRKEDSPHNAEDFMKALLSLYRGEIVDYEEIPDAGGPPARQEDEERAV